MAKKQPSNDVSIGKFDILATYTYAHALLNGPLGAAHLPAPRKVKKSTPVLVRSRSYPEL